MDRETREQKINSSMSIFNANFFSRASFSFVFALCVTLKRRPHSQQRVCFWQGSLIAVISLPSHNGWALIFFVMLLADMNLETNERNHCPCLMSGSGYEEDLGLRSTELILSRQVLPLSSARAVFFSYEPSIWRHSEGCYKQRNSLNPSAQPDRDSILLSGTRWLDRSSMPSRSPSLPHHPSNLLLHSRPSSIKQ